MKRLTTVAAALALAGCVSAPEEMFAYQTPPSAALKAQIVSAAKDYLFDPFSVRDAEISSVMPLDKKRGLSVVCVKANARNQMGGYTGRQATSVRLMNGRIVNAIPNAPGCNDQRIDYHPFPELERR